MLKQTKKPNSQTIIIIYKYKHRATMHYIINYSYLNAIDTFTPVLFYANVS